MSEYLPSKINYLPLAGASLPSLPTLPFLRSLTVVTKSPMTALAENIQEPELAARLYARNLDVMRDIAAQREETERFLASCHLREVESTNAALTSIKREEEETKRAISYYTYRKKVELGELAYKAGKFTAVLSLAQVAIQAGMFDAGCNRMKVSNTRTRFFSFFEKESFVVEFR